MMEHKQVPPNLHLKKLNPNIDLSNFACTIPDSVIDWNPPAGAVRVAGVSSFGFSGTNSHVNLQEAPQAELEAVLEAAVTRSPMTWSRNDLSYKDWAKQLWSAITWQPLPAGQASVEASEDWLVIGGGDLTSKAMKAALPKATSAGLEQLSSSAKVKKLLSERAWQCIVFAEPLLAEDPTLEGPTLAALLTLVQGLAEDKRSVKLVLMSAGAQSASGSAIGRGLLGASCWGFMRSVRLEVPHLQLRTVDFSADADLSEILLTELAATADWWPADEEKAGSSACRTVG